MYYYTYAYLREDRTPYYIGKGSGRRIYENKGRPCGKPKDKSRIIFLKQNLTEEEAFKHEIYMIAVFGRIDLGTGILNNRSDGGEGNSGYKHTEKNKEIFKEYGKIYGKIGGKKCYELGLGTFSRTKEQITEHSKISGNIAGTKTRDLKIGIHALTSEQISEAGKKGGKITGEKNMKECVILSPSGEVIKGKNIKLFCKENNLSQGNLSNVILGKRKSHKGYTLCETSLI
jgi:hypothetical protein